MLITNCNEAARRFSFLQNPIQPDRLAPISLKKSEFLAQGNNPQDKLDIEGPKVETHLNVPYKSLKNDLNGDQSRIWNFDL